jgi:hypothetical protein
MLARLNYSALPVFNSWAKFNLGKVYGEKYSIAHFSNINKMVLLSLGSHYLVVLICVLEALVFQMGIATK